MSNWVESFVKLKSFSEASQAVKVKTPLSDADFVEGLTGWLDTDITEYTEGASEAVSRRAVWVFDDRWIVTVGSELNIVIASLHDKVNPDMKVPLVEDFDETEWVYDEAINGWSYTEPLEYENLIYILNELSTVHGVPKLVLPWEYWIEQTVDQGEEYYSYWDDDEEKLNLRKAFYELMVMLSEGKIVSVSPWETVIVYEDDFMSDYCRYSMFDRMVSELYDSGEWMVILDEHCASCSRGSRESFYSQDEKWRTAPEFMTWGQNSQHSYLPDGRMWTEVYVEDYVWGLKLIRIANKHGFNLPVPENQDEYSSELTFE